MAAARRATSLVGLLALLVGVAAPVARASPQDLEMAIEATYLARLAHFITWPAGVFATPFAPVTICVQGPDPFGAVLDRLVEGRRIGDRAVVIRRVARIEPRSGCQVAYIGGGPAQSEPQALESVGDAPVLTVTDERKGPGPRGVFHFVQDGPRLRFFVDAEQAGQSGMTISSKLLALAAAVRR